MPMTNQRYIMGERFWRVVSGVTKDYADKVAKSERKRGYKARLEKIKRGDYSVWTNRPWANL